ncbi:MAG: hypothetical protein M1814_000725 [Vezdaea aestivalis]|nr:MAG: hypothetical protein M1814_000725 [Vezdaea aestivalis]
MVRQNRHPDVCAWINDAVTAVHNELAKGVIERVSMVISSSNSVPLERFVFDVSSLPVYSDGDEIVETDHSSSAEETESPLASIIIPMADVEEQYRATLMKISTCDAKLAKLPENCVFTISVELKDRADPPIGHPQPWIPAQPSLERAGHELKVREHAKIMGPKSTPLRSIETERIKIECWVQESQAKFSLGQSEL